MMDQLKIDTSEDYPHLGHAPIVEAALEIRARAEAAWDERLLLDTLKDQLPDYPTLLQRRDFRHEFELGPNEPAKGEYKDLGLVGYQIQSGDGLQVARFDRDGFSFARLRPYESWERFKAESFRLWEIYASLAQPSQVERLGLRFINRIEIMPQLNDLANYLNAPPQTPADLKFPRRTFLHQDSFAVPGHPYIVNLVQAIQPGSATGSEGPALIFDIDVFSEQRFPLESDVLRHQVEEMRCLKNKFFFGSIAPLALETFR